MTINPCIENKEASSQENFVKFHLGVVFLGVVALMLNVQVTVENRIFSSSERLSRAIHCQGNFYSDFEIVLCHNCAGRIVAVFCDNEF